MSMHGFENDLNKNNKVNKEKSVQKQIFVVQIWKILHKLDRCYYVIYSNRFVLDP